MAVAAESPIADRIVDASLALAEEVGWPNVRLHQVARHIDLPLARVFEHFRDLDAVADAWFERARMAMVQVPEEAIDGLPADRRLATALMAWFDALAQHRGVTGQMLRGKLYLSHPHHWVPLVFDLSRHVHALLDAARIESTGRQRQLAEVGMTVIFLAALRDWLRDRGADSKRTRARLNARLGFADRWLGRLGHRRSRGRVRHAENEE
jgi:AcrR family transcriptional regulator